MQVKKIVDTEIPVSFKLISASSGEIVGEVSLTLTQAERFVKVFGDDYKLEQIEEN